MAENQAQRKQTNRNQQPDPPTPHVLNRVASKIQHAGWACMNILTSPKTAGALIFTGIFLALAYRNRGRANKFLRRRRGRDAGPGRVEQIRPLLQRSMSIAALHGGRLALERIIDAQEARLNDAKLDRADAEFEELLNPSDGRMHFSKLQSVAGKLEMTGKEDEAVALLRKAIEKATPHEAHELGMLLVEMLIYKGDYDEALTCPWLYDEGITDARAALYKAVIYSIKGDKKAEENYRRFQDIQARLLYPDGPKEETPLYDVVHDFSKFQIIVQNLKKEIEKVKKRKVVIMPG
ncbi:uncharacterized protein LOC110098206 [Dendrobium catenatum]|uniref:uncharacterized protein LOC110098206 n=1 Tax=Dendrobium catenatum TaxID=906689 RepID=UPI0009F1E453|nr:uncharacterized protein LOC110098206 [Dendrobium catenatum]